AEQPAADPDLVAAERAVEDGDLDAAAAAYERLLARAPANADAKVGLAGVGLLKRTQGLNPAEVLRRAAERPTDIDTQLQSADLELLSGAIEAAFNRLIGVIRRTSGDERDRVRLHLIGLFDTLPVDDPAVVKARRSLASALF
ncbi:MAG TPA: tetratricopeptide repeat protein, partial [Thermopolyspora sp.]